MKPRLKSRSSAGGKNPRVPLSKLRTSEVVRTVVDHPRRLEELVNLLQDKERVIRGRAAERAPVACGRPCVKPDRSAR